MPPSASSTVRRASAPVTDPVSEGQGARRGETGGWARGLGIGEATDGGVDSCPVDQELANGRGAECLDGDRHDTIAAGKRGDVIRLVRSARGR